MSFRYGLLLGACILLVACGPAASVEDKPIGTPVRIEVPLGLPPLKIPADNPVTVESIALGRKLFHDTGLSMNDKVSCASCHNALLGFADSRKTSLGVSGKNGKRNAPTVLNAAYHPVQFWDGRAASLEEQAGGPIADPDEMSQAHDLCTAKLESDPAYKAAFADAFGPGPVTIGKVQKAIASFERTLLSGNSPFDRYEFGKQKNALSPAAIRGLAVFRDPARGNCLTCHTIERSSALFSDGRFHNIGVGVNAEGLLTDLGRYERTRVESDKGAFRTPTLRNVAKTGPYMHDGGLKTLRAVIDYYAGGGNWNEFLDKQMKPLALSGRDKDDLIAFLESLTGEPGS